MKVVLLTSMALASSVVAFADQAAPKASQTSEFTGYIHYQWLSTDKPGAKDDGFHLRRIRIGTKRNLDERTAMKLSFDFAGGKDDIDASLKDAILYYDLDPENGLRLTAGQFSNPIGYEISRSSSRREMPERTKYNRTVFDGGRIRGLMVEKPIGGGKVFLGAANALSIKDDELFGLGNGVNPGQSLAGFGGVRFDGEGTSFGISGWAGRRPEFATSGNTVESPAIDRSFLYLDGYVADVAGTGVSARAELMTGRDRLAGAGGAARPMVGWHVQLGSDVSPRTQLFTRYAQFDADTGEDGNLLEEYGIGLRYALNGPSTLSLAHVVEEDPSKTQTRWSTWTLRWQVKF